MCFIGPGGFGEPNITRQTLKANTDNFDTTMGFEKKGTKRAGDHSILFPTVQQW